MHITSKPLLIAFVLTIISGQVAIAGDLERRQAKRIHDRLAGVPATNAVINQMESALLLDDSGKSAAAIALQNPAFYNVTLKNFAAPWTNEEQTVFVPLNDYSATVIGMIRDNVDFREVLYGDIIYTGNNSPAYADNSNAHYEALENLGPVAGDLSNPSILIKKTQSTVTGVGLANGTAATAGIITTRAAAKSFFSDGTNRAMFRFTLMNHLCTDLEPLKDISRIPDKIRQDVSRSPGGDSRLFLNGCIGCHAGMDGMAGAFAYYEYDYTTDKETGRLSYIDGTVRGKHLINSDNFKSGYEMTDDSWVNYWRNGPNWLLGWGVPFANLDAKGKATGNGAQELGRELANSHAFAQCQVDKVFQAVCFRDPNDYAADRSERDDIVAEFKTGYQMKQVFGDVAAWCKGG